jgi:hypothetical protein
MVAVVEEADVPAAAHAAEKRQERAGALGELEAVQTLVACAGPTTDHEAHVQLGDLVARHVDHRQLRSMPA